MVVCMYVLVHVCMFSVWPDKFMTFSGMQVKHRKCSVLHGPQSGNDWSKTDGAASTELIIQGCPAPMFSNTQPYT